MPYGINFVVSFLEKKLGKRVARQILYVTLMLFGVKRKTIRDVLGAADTTLCRYSAAIERGEIESIFEQNYHRPQSVLEEYREQIEAYFDEKPPANLREASVEIEKMTGVKRSMPQIGVFLKKGDSKPGP